MKIKWTKQGSKFNMAYFAGDVADIEDKKAAEIINAGYAVAVEGGEPAEKPTKKTVKKGA